ncbi:MAG TPA: thioesterase family protein [Flavisolibacter sp.]|nr:thioesterase family protein [Flavisolibacter sp.]
MKEFSRIMEVRWSDLDPNFHVRHSVYYDWAAFCRFEFLNDNGLTADIMRNLSVGPILFREECVFRKEIKFGDHIHINLSLSKSRKDFSRWSIQHHIYKDKDNLAAVLNVDGAWMDINKRKLATPPEEVHMVFSKMPMAENFEWS